MRVWPISGAVLVMITGCSTGGAGVSQNQKAPADSNLKGAQALLDKYLGVPEFKPPGPKFDAKAIAAGKKLFALPSSSAVPFQTATANEYKRIAQGLGASVTIWTNQGQTSEWVQGVQAARTDKANAIALINGTDPRLIMPQIVEAKKAGIPTIDVHDLDLSQEQPPNVAAFVSGSFTTAGKLVAAGAITDTKANANVLILTSNNYINSKPVGDGMLEEFKADCPSCKVTTVNIDAPDWATKIQGTVQTAITRDPKLNYVLPVFDGMMTSVVAGIRGAGAEGRVFSASFNGSPAVLDMIRDGKIVKMDVGENPSYIAAAGVDQTLRVVGGLEPSKDENLVLRVFTKDNVQEAGVPAALGKGYGEAWVEGFNRVWGVG